MNINDVDEKDVPQYSHEALLHIFARQRELMDKYHHIEKANGLLQTMDVPVDLNDRLGQARLKDFAWRITEELTESTEALGKDEHHAREEAADALHFLVELFILSGISPAEVTSYFDFKTEDTLCALFNASNKAHGPLMSAYLCIEWLGKAMNCLKQKPWKQTHVLTDEVKYKRCLYHALQLFCDYATTIGHSNISVFEFYFRKSEVNKFRQRSAY